MKKKEENGNKRQFSTKKKILIIVGTLVVLMFASGFAVLKASENPSFCGICHTMDPYMASYEEGSLLAKKHADAEVKCQDCHQETLGRKIQKGVNFITGNFETPFEKRDFGTFDYCLECHDDPDKVDKVFETVKAETFFEDGSNPHQSHNGDLDCNVCHNMHRKSVVFCQDCHFRPWVADLDPESWEIQ